MRNQIEYAGGNGSFSREENALRKSANAPPLIRAKILRHFGRNDEAEGIERRHMSPEDFAAHQAELSGAEAASEDDALRERIKQAALTV